MYLNRNKHYLSNAIIISAMVHILIMAVQLAVRLLQRETSGQTPDMLNENIRIAQFLLSMLQITALALIFLSYHVRLKRELSLVKDDDNLQMAVLQKETFGDGLPSLSGLEIRALLQLWGVILVGVRLIYEINTARYQHFISDLMELAAPGNSALSEGFVAIYNNTHGFKYLGLLLAILLGVMMTGILLHDRILECSSVALMAFFLISFSLMEMQTIEIWGVVTGVVWTSVITHLTETAGLMFLGIYLRKRYIGV